MRAESLHQPRRRTAPEKIQKNMNKIEIVGNLTAAPEIMYTNSGKAVAKFTVACDRGRGENAGTDFIRIEAWDHLAESVNVELGKGDFVRIAGSLRISNFEKDGATRSTAHIVARKVARVTQEAAA